MSVGDAVQAVVLVLALAVALGLLLVVRRTTRRTGARIAQDPSIVPALPPQAHRVAVVANPTKLVHAHAELAWVGARCETLGLDDPLWLETTADDPGHGQTREAVAHGVDAVVAYGGDGTVRAVAAELCGTDVPLGIIPAGTGNLLARNLALAVTDLDAALDTALTGTERTVDVGLAEIDVSGEDQQPRRDIFLVMAGLGFDAEVMATVTPELKERVGWWAYIVAGTQRLTGRRTRVVLRLDDGEPISRRVRTVIIGNCGELTGGFRLMPDAELDDGLLDVAVIAPATVVGWGAVVATVLSHYRRSHPIVEHFRCRTIEVRAESPLHVQLDGDVAGTARVLRATVDPLALRVRVP